MNPTPVSPSKPFYLSKTFWTNVVALLSLAVPPVRDFLQANPVEFVAVIGAVNILLRFVTKGAISISHDDGPGGFSGLPVWVAAVALIGGSVLPSCSPLSSAITGAPIPATAIQRAGQPQAPVVMVASADLAVAEDAAARAEILNEPAPVQGLYDAGRAAEVVRGVFIEPSK
jgi:hypothetical protein